MDLLRLLLLLCISGCLCQQDCTGVDCPVLHNCIEQLLETNVCCPTCLQIGCSCEGYQYYDCMHAGFQNGRVPEGESYFVDFGSTECSCPQGGGRIGCHFIPCPELPANCIEVLEPTDGCAQCKRIGCTHMAQQYEAGHSFRVDPCQVCHCPNDGGKLMCYPIPDCDPRRTHKPTLTTSTEESPAWRGTSDPIRHVLDRQGSFSKPFALLHADKLPPFNLSPTHIGDEEEEEEEGEEDDYDYTTTDSFEPSSRDLVSPTGSSIVPAPHAENIPAGRAFREGAKQELKERFGVHKLTPNRQPFPLQDGSILALLDSKETTGGTRYEFHNNTLKKDALNISEDSTNEDQFPIYRANADNEEFSVHGDTQSFSLYKVNTDNNVPEEKNTEFEGFAIPKETADSGGSDYEHIAYTDAFTPSPAATTQTPPRLWETEATAPWPPTDRSVWAERTLPLEPDAGADSVWRRDEVSMTLTTVPSNDVTDSGRNPEDDRMDDKWEETTVSSLEAKTESDSGRGPVRSAWRRVEIEGTPGSSTAPTMRFSPTSQPLEDKTLGPFHVGAEEEVEREEKEHHLGSFPKGHEALVENCCGAGQKWAVEKQHCDRLPPGPGPGSMCGMVQQQCCVAALRERRCLLGINSAKTGEMCEESSSPQCGEDSQKECCSCCALGLRMRRESKGCDMHRYLSYPCGHIFLTCCEEEEHEEARTPELRRKERPIPTTLPKKVADGQYSKQPLSVEDSELVANSVEKPEAVDECQRHERQPCHHRCISTAGSYRCACHPGYVLQQDGHACVLENPEEDNRVREEDRLFTLATSQLETLTRTPPPHDPCAGGGPCSQRCAVVRGLPRCSCFLGYSLKADGHTCEDLNECVTNTHTCQHHERCVNTVGAFMCEKQMSCPSGYQLRNGVCEDVDECAVRSHDCEPGAECLNTVGSFHCKQRGCLGGFSQDPHGNCIDVDECSRLQDPCSAGFHCINTVGSYTCQRKTMTCNRGYHSSPDEARCVDVNECAMGTHHCTESQVCHNLPGSYRCDCRSGYQYDSIRRLCVDVNECWRYPGRLCAQTCDNTVGSYQCSCTAGFSLAFDGKNCEDLNECDNNPCSQECANIYGSYQCYCRLGYYLKEDGHTCEDINECSQSIGNLCAFQCVNVPGSYQCACPPEGYSMSPNGRTCRDVDECATGTHNCTAAGQTCYNLPGSFRCLDFSCPDNYRRASDKRCERVSCSSWLECQSMPLRITYYQLSFQTNIVIPAQIFRIGPSPAYSGDNIVVSIPRGNEDGYFGTRRLNSFTGAVYLQRQPEGPRDFFIDVEMKLLRQGALSTFLARIYVFITAHAA
ncbi:fibulin-2 isoform X2 [Electrophorus electricus]|uniref:fibulin-2 isoform X2 n=1 Tax=Electrophorus electricus TaxID=8005 RepID=UPI0015D0917A|nr:fibulin-2 isoform X2 [Electrophorus electricus]